MSNSAKPQSTEITKDHPGAESVVSQQNIPAPGWLKTLAIFSGLGALVLFLLVPFMPVKQQQSSITWPQNSSLHSINAPLVSYAPQEFSADIPLAAIDYLREGQTLLLGTLSEQAVEASNRGAYVRTDDGGLEVTFRSLVILSLSAREVAALPANSVLEITSTYEATTVRIADAELDEEADEPDTIVVEEDLRPVIGGLYTEVEDDSAAYQALSDAGFTAHIEIDSRFTSSPTVLKLLVIGVGIALTIVSLYCLWRLDRLDGRKLRRTFTLRSFKPTPLDGVVLFTLGYWHIFGANTSDDGFIFTMARASQDSTYLANYYRWFGAPESPFGSPYYDLLSWIMHVSVASVWMRLPALFAGLMIWYLLSRQVLPRLGDKIGNRRVARWTAGFMFLAFWLPYNNGLRPEPIIALGALLTWTLLEVAIANKRLFPAALGVMVAAFTLTCGPTGLIAVAALLAALSSLIIVFAQRMKMLGATGKNTPWRNGLALLAPILGAGTLVLVPIFSDQTLSTVIASTKVRTAVGPSLPWYQEYQRYAGLFATDANDGSFARRFAVIFLALAVTLVLIAIFRFHKVPGSNSGPTKRMLLVLFGSVFFLMFTPTKWTHHFGIWAGVAAALAALAAVAMSHIAVRSARNRTLLIGMVLFFFSISLAGINGWWYVSAFKVPWYDRLPQYNAVEFTTVVMILSLVVMAIGVVLAFIHDFKKSQNNGETPVESKSWAAYKASSNRYLGLMASPLALAAILAVAVSMASLGKGFISQYPAYTVGLGNLRSLTGNTCAMADYVLVEDNTNESFLTPVNSSLGESLEVSEDARGFSATKVPTQIWPDDAAQDAEGATDTTPTQSDAASGGENVSATELATSENMGLVGNNSSGSTTSTSSAISTEEQEEEGINGTTISLPFGIDYTRVPVVGSWSSGQQEFATITTDWYELPKATAEAPLLVVSAAGRIAFTDVNGVEQPGQTLVVEYGTLQSNGKVEILGERQFDQPEAQPEWRNLRIALDEFPEEANVVRLQAEDSSLDAKQWLVFTPPRVPNMVTLNEYVGSDSPVLLDWQVPLQFPCQRPFSHYAGVAETPEYRILGDSRGISGTVFQDSYGGGAGGTPDFVADGDRLPTYFKDDWNRDWGYLNVYEKRTNSVGEVPNDAIVDIEEVTRSGLWNSGPMNTDV